MAEWRCRPEMSVEAEHLRSLLEPKTWSQIQLPSMGESFLFRHAQYLWRRWSIADAQLGINRAIPDSDFKAFVDKYARRVSSFDHYAIAAAKRTINKRDEYFTVAEHQEDFQTFLDAASQPLVQKHVAALIENGLQTDLNYELNSADDHVNCFCSEKEINSAEEIIKFVGPGPWET